MSMSLDIRPLQSEDLAAAMVNMGRYFLFGASLRDRVVSAEKHWELDRHLGAFEGGELVGLAGALSLHTTVPGGAVLETCGLTRVGVLPTHTRRGILAALMHEQFGESRRRGEALSSLRASQAPIYGRFGYGVAGHCASYRLATVHARFAAPLVDGGRIRLLPAPEVVETLPKLYDIVGRDHVGAISRPSGLWHFYFGDFRSEPLSSERWVAVHENAAGNPDGYLDYEATDRDRWSEAGNIVAVNDLLALNPVAYGALWNFVLNQDLIAVVTAGERPLDEPLRHLLADPRRLETQSVVDEQWLRLIDVAGALAARTFTGAAAVALAIQDANFADNTGTYVVADGSARRDDDARPELSLGVSALGAAYLGGVSFAELAMAGQVIEHSGGALKRADAAFAVRPLAWCGSFF